MKVTWKINFHLPYIICVNWASSISNKYLNRRGGYLTRILTWLLKYVFKIDYSLAATKRGFFLLDFYLRGRRATTPRGG